MYENHKKQRFFERNVRKCKKLAKLIKTALQNARTHEKPRVSIENIFITSSLPRRIIINECTEVRNWICKLFTEWTPNAFNSSIEWIKNKWQEPGFIDY